MSQVNSCKFDGHLKPEDTKTFHQIPLEIQDGTACLRLRFSYGPQLQEDLEAGRETVHRKLAEYKSLLRQLGDKVVEELEKREESIIESVVPLRNLLNFCLYDPRGNFRGRWDSPQYFDQWVEVGPPETTSRGFIPGKIIPGKWTVEIEVHAIVTPECRYSLAVETVVEDVGTSTAGTGGPDYAVVKNSRFAEVTAAAANVSRGWDWYKGELHLHSNHSDAKASLSEMAEAASRRGLDFIVLTDHNTVSGHAAIPDACLPVIPGMELTTFYGHAVAIGVDKFIDWREPRNSDLQKQTEEVHSSRGLFSIAHPYVLDDPICTGCGWRYDQIDMRRVDLIEVWSGSWRKGWAHNRLALKWWDELLNSGLKIVGVGARDVHDPRQLFIPDTPNTCVWAESPTRSALLEGLRQGRVYVSSGPGLNLFVEAGGQRHGIGSAAKVAGNEVLTWNAIITDLDEPAVLRIIENGEVVRECDAANGALTWKSGPSEWGRCWVRAELLAKKDEGVFGKRMLALTNPVFVQWGDALA